MPKFICYGCGEKSPPCRLEAPGIEPHLEPGGDELGGYCPSDGTRAAWRIEEEEEDE